MRTYLSRFVVHIQSWANGPYAMYALAFVAFIESSLFPVPPYVLVFAMLIHEKRPSWVRVALVGTGASVLGGLLGYVIGKFFYTLIALPLIQFYGLEVQMESLGGVFNHHVFWTILLASFTPIPYKVFTISAGIFSAPLIPFIISSCIGRSVRFFAVAYLTNIYGVQARNIFMRHSRTATVCVLILISILIGYSLFNR